MTSPAVQRAWTAGDVSSEPNCPGSHRLPQLRLAQDDFDEVIIAVVGQRDHGIGGQMLVVESQ